MISSLVVVVMERARWDFFMGERDGEGCGTVLNVSQMQ